MDDRLLQELQETRLQLNSHLIDLRRELSRVRQSMQQARLSVPAGDAGADGGAQADWWELDRQPPPGMGPSAASLNGLPQEGEQDSSRPRAASASAVAADAALHLPPGPRFPLNPTSSRLGPSSTGAPAPRSPRESSYRNLLRLLSDGVPPGPDREFDPSRATRGSVRLLSRTPDGAQLSASTDRPDQGPDGWAIPVYPFDSARGGSDFGNHLHLPALGRPSATASSSNRTAAGVPESSAEPSTTRRPSNARPQGGVGFVRPGSAAASLLLGSVWEGPPGQPVDARRSVDNLRAAFLPRTVNIPPPSPGGAHIAPGLGQNEGTSSVGRGLGRPRPNPPPGTASREYPYRHLSSEERGHTSRLPPRPMTAAAGELDPNGETLRFDGPGPLPTFDRREPSTDSEQLPVEPSVWSTLPTLPPTPNPSRIETFGTSASPDFGAPGFELESRDAHRRLERTSGLLEDLQQRREHLRSSVASLQNEPSSAALSVEDRRRQLDRSADLLETLRLRREASEARAAAGPTGNDGSGAQSYYEDLTAARQARANLRPPEQSTPVGSPAQPLRSVSSRLLVALGGGDGLGDLDQRTARAERERAAGGDWDGWASYTNLGTGAVEFEGAWVAPGGSRSPSQRRSSPGWSVVVAPEADPAAAPGRTRSVLRAYLQQGDAPPAGAAVDAVLRRAEQEDAEQAIARSRMASPPSVARRDRPGGSRRNAPWLLGDGDQDLRTDTRSGEEARFWPDVTGNGTGTVIFDVPRAHAESLLASADREARAPLLGAAAPIGSDQTSSAVPPHPWRQPSAAAAASAGGHRSQGIFIRTRTPPHQHRGPSFLDYNGDPLFPGEPRAIMPCPSRRSSGGGARPASAGAPPPPSGLAPLKRDANGDEEWFERPGPVELPAFLRGEGPDRKWARRTERERGEFPPAAAVLRGLDGHVGR